MFHCGTLYQQVYIFLCMCNVTLNANIFDYFALVSVDTVYITYNYSFFFYIVPFECMLINIIFIMHAYNIIYTYPNQTICTLYISLADRCSTGATYNYFWVNGLQFFFFFKLSTFKSTWTNVKYAAKHSILQSFNCDDVIYILIGTESIFLLLLLRSSIGRLYDKDCYGFTRIVGVKLLRIKYCS